MPLLCSCLCGFLLSFWCPCCALACARFRCPCCALACARSGAPAVLLPVLVSMLLVFSPLSSYCARGFERCCAVLFPVLRSLRSTSSVELAHADRKQWPITQSSGNTFSCGRNSGHRLFFTCHTTCNSYLNLYAP